MATTYVPALLPDGDVPLTRALAFIALAQEVTQAALAESLGDVSADTSPEPAAGFKPVTASDQIAGAAEGPRPLTGFELFDAVVHGRYAPEGRPWAPRFAAVLLWAEDAAAPASGTTPAGFRPVTEAEAAGPSFPLTAFAEAYGPFAAASAKLTHGLLGTPSGTGSSSTGAAGTTTPT